jgi:hypothetical protein
MCNCNSTPKPKGYITEVKTILRKMWKNSEIQEKTLVIKKINKP